MTNRNSSINDHPNLTKHGYHFSDITDLYYNDHSKNPKKAEGTQKEHKLNKKSGYFVKELKKVIK